MEDKRTEYVSIYVTPEVKKEFNLAKDTPALQETILRRFLRSETEFMESEMKAIDDYTIRYKAKLIGIRDAFDKTQDSYIEEIEAINEKVQKTLTKIDTVTRPLNDQCRTILSTIKAINTSIADIDIYKLERLISTVEAYNNMSDSQKELIKLLVTK